MRTRIKALIVTQIVTLTACGGTPNTQELLAPDTNLISSSTTSEHVDTPYAYSGNPTCWTDKLKTNGPSYGTAGNTYYACYTKSFTPLDNQQIKIGFYRDGTISYTRRDGSEVVYTAFGNAANCDLALDNSDHSSRYVILTGGTLNASSQLTGVTNQMYYTTPPALTDTYPLNCQLVE